MLGPVVAGFLIDRHLHLEYLALLVLGCAVTAWLSVFRLEPQLDDVANGIRRPTEPVVPDPATPEATRPVT